MRNTFKRQAKRIITKVMASTLIVSMSCTNFLAVGSYMVTYAAESKAELDKQTDATLSKNVKFDAYFEENNQQTHYKTADLNKDAVNLVVSIDVQKEGYLKNATIDLKNGKGENQLNFTITDLQDENAIVQSASENQLVLRQVNSGSKITFLASLTAGLNEAPSLEQLAQENVLTLKGLYIDGEGEETPIEKDIKINLKWTGKYEAQIEQSLIKYIPIEQEEGNKTLVSMQLKTGLKPEKFILPVQETKIEITVPKIQNEKPTQVTVTALSTEATNGLTAENIEFTEENWNYNQETGTIEIKVNNEQKALGKNQDEYILNYVYSEKVYEALKEQEAEVGQKSKVTIKTYTADGTEETTAQTEDKTYLKDAFGKLISLQGANITQSIPKGQLYANLNNPESNDKVQYEYKWLVNIAYTNGLAGVVLEDVQEKMNTSTTAAILNKQTIYKQIIFNSNAFEELLGDEGTIKIYNKEDRLLGIVAKDTRTDKEGNYLIELLEEVSQVKMVTSKPITSGNLVVNVIKEIKSNIGFTKTQIDNFTNLEATVSVSQIDEKTTETTLVEEKTVAIPLEASITKSKISINKEKLSTLMTNEDVEITIELGNDDIKSDLYVDPIFEIELPKCVENVEILEKNLFFEEELIIEKVEFTHKGDIPVIRVILDGVQTKFSTGVVTNGTNIVLKTNITVNNLTPTSTEEIKMYYYNSNTKNYDNGVETDRGLGGLATTTIEFSAPTGMLAIGGITNYNGQGNTIMSVNQGELIQQVLTYQPSRTMKMHIIAINNTGNTADNVVIMGRIPFAGSKDIQTGEEIGTTIDTYLASIINSETLEGDGVKIYYTENGEATSALGDSNNGWTLEPSNLDNVKSYMIVLENYEMPQGQMIVFNYDLEIPENIGYNHTINSNFGIYFVNNTQVATVSSFAKSDKIGITTGRGPELQITQTVEGAEQGTIDEFKVLKYIINVTNTGTEAATNVNIENPIPKWTQLVRSKTGTLQYGDMEIYQTTTDKATMKEWNVVKNATEEIGSTPTVGWTVPSIQPGETVTREVYILVEKTPTILEYYHDYPGFTAGEDEKYYISTDKYDPETDTTYEQKNEITDVPEIEVQNTVEVTASNINAVLKASSDTVTVDETSLAITENHNIIDITAVPEKELCNFTISITNSGEETAKDITVTKKIPEGLKFKDAYFTSIDKDTGLEKKEVTGEYNTATRVYTAQINEIEKGGTANIVVAVQTENLETGVYEKNIITNSSYVYGDKQTSSSTPIEFTVVKPHYEVKQTCTNSNAKINAGDEITYYIKVTNVGKMDISGLTIEQKIPEAFELLEANYQILGMNTNIQNVVDNKIIASVILQQGESTTLTVRVGVKDVSEDTTVMTNAYIYGENLETTYTDIIVQTIEKSIDSSESSNGTGSGSGSTDNENTDGNIKRTYKISGTAWLDSNENGVRDIQEDLLSNITVQAIDVNTGEVAKDATTGENIQTTTGQDGKYLLTNLRAGDYIVVFKYNTVIYKTTNYQVAGESELVNSDAIEKTISDNGKQTLAGVTNTLKVNVTIANIDLGLIERAKFDLNLEKTIKQITVQNGEGVKAYNYDNSKFAKVEIASNHYQNSTVVIEYAIKITNEGNVAGYAKEIVDYKPETLTFNSDLNANWYVGSDGNVYSTELANTLIQPGETKEIKLILTKKMSDDNTAMLNNRAEIQESISELGLGDKDSVAGNNAQGEDDIGLADVIITIKTGGPVFYSFITLISLTILAAGIYVIKNKTIKKSEEVYK